MFWMVSSGPSRAAGGKSHQGSVESGVGRSYWGGWLGEWGQRLAELLTGPSCPTHGLPDAVGVEGNDCYLVLGQWPETLQPRAGLTSWDAHLPRVRGHFIVPSQAPSPPPMAPDIVTSRRSLGTGCPSPVRGVYWTL